MEAYILDKKALTKGWGTSEQYWFSLHTYRIVEYEDLLSIDVPDGTTHDSYYYSLGYVPYFFVSSEQAIKKFVESVEQPKLKLLLENINDSNYVDSFWKYANAYPSLAEEYGVFEDGYILSQAILWCEKHGIKYDVV